MAENVLFKKETSVAKTVALMKQLFTASFAAVMVMLLISSVDKEALTPAVKQYLLFALLFHFCAIIIGLFGQAISLNISDDDPSKSPLVVQAINNLVAVQIICFLSGLLATFAFGILRLCPMWPFC